MKREIGFSSFILSAILIASCATDRIHYAQKSDPDCKIPETRYDFGKRIQAREIRSDSRRYSRYSYHEDRRKRQTGYSSLKSAEKKKNSETNIYRNGEMEALSPGTISGINELAFFEVTTKTPVISLFHHSLIGMPVTEIAINDFPEVDISGRTEELPSILGSSDSESERSYDLLKMEVEDEVLSSTGNADKTRDNPIHGSMDYLLLMALMAGIIPFAAIKAKPQLANNISFWAAMNPWKTRFMFAGAQVALGASGILLGTRLADSGMHFTDLSKDIMLGTFLTSALLYPVRYSSVRLLKHSYLRQKAFDLALALSGFLLMINVGNTNPDLKTNFNRMANFKANIDQNVRLLDDQNQIRKSMTYVRGEKELMVEQDIVQKKEMSKGTKIALTVLIIIAGLGLGYLLVAAACGLSCNGMEGLAYLVGIGGGILLITLAILVIKRIWNPKRKNRAKPSGVPGALPAEGTLQV